MAGCHHQLGERSRGGVTGDEQRCRPNGYPGTALQSTAGPMGNEDRDGGGWWMMMALMMMMTMLMLLLSPTITVYEKPFVWMLL